MTKPKFTWENVKNDKWFLLQLFILVVGSLAWFFFSLFYSVFR